VVLTLPALARKVGSQRTRKLAGTREGHYGQHRPKGQRVPPECRLNAKCKPSQVRRRFLSAFFDRKELEVANTLAGKRYPIMGVRTGAAFVRHGVTGFVVDRLPPGQQCVGSEDDERALAAYLDAVRKALAMDRRFVRAAAAGQFATDRIVDTILDVLAGCRLVPPAGGEPPMETADAKEGRRGG